MANLREALLLLAAVIQTVTIPDPATQTGPYLGYGLGAAVVKPWRPGWR